MSLPIVPYVPMNPALYVGRGAVGEFSWINYWWEIVVAGVVASIVFMWVCGVFVRWTLIGEGPLLRIVVSDFKHISRLRLW